MKTTKTAQPNPASFLFVTSDERVFFDAAAAESHAGKLQDNKVRTLTRKEAEEMTSGFTAGASHQDELEAFLDELTGN